MTTDHLGSPRLITNQNGAVTKRQDFAAFGDGRSPPSAAHSVTSTDELRQDYTVPRQRIGPRIRAGEILQHRPRPVHVGHLTASATIRDPQSFNRSTC
ncbi:MAG: hypothetical protein IPJ30_16285 [Acidobacteria bacterium]|nr:hypothetical protein [Acidobacteriota bacterium]